MRERLNFNAIWFQQDHWPAHNTRNVTNLLNTNFKRQMDR